MIESFDRRSRGADRVASGSAVGLSQSQPDTTVCTVTGKISGDTTPVLRDALAAARRDDNAHLVIDLSAVTSMDATGLYALFEALGKHNIGGGGHLASLLTLIQKPSMNCISLR